MPDREKVIKAYEDFVNGYECFCTSDDYEYEMHKAVLALLKEQEEIIQCKDCYYYHKPEYGFTIGDCTYRTAWYPVKENEFCSLAKRKEGR